jgi:predicted kinase
VLDLKGLVALPLFLALRAGIRAMVTIDRSAQEESEARDRDIDQARAYFEAARAHIDPPPPRLIAVGGLSGTGKTTLARALSPLIGGAPGAVHFRSDLERKALAGVGEFERLPADAYTAEAREQIYQALAERAHFTLAAGRPVVVDAVYATERQRRQIETVARDLGVPFHGLWLHADPGTLVARVTARRDDASDATAETVRGQLLAEIGSLSPSWSPVDASRTPDETVILALSCLALR